MPFDSRLDTDAAGFRLDAALDWSAGGQFRASGAFQPSVMSLEGIERLATFGYRAHALTCCPCGEDHSGELLAHKISIAAIAGTAASGASVGGTQYAPPGSPEAQTLNLAGEVDGTIATTVTLAVGDIVNSQIEVSGDQDWFRINLQAGVTYEFRLDATGGTGLGDPFLEIMNASGTQLKTNDDGGTGFNSLLRFTPTASGTYYINAHGWIDTNGGTSTGSYALTTQVLPPIPTWTIDQIGQYLANEDGVGVGPRWQSSTITYNIEDLNANERIMAERALQMWAAASSLSFVRTTSASAGITFVNAVADDPNASQGTTDPVAYARTSTSGNSILSSRIVISSNWTTLDANAQAGWFDNYAQQTYIHEVGHALGLSHPGPYDGTADYGTDNLFTNDNWAYTVMSYFDQLEVGHGNYRFVLGLQQADIAAIQLLYGTNPAGTFSGNTTFGFNSSAPGTNIDWSQFVVVLPEGTYRRPPAMTLYDTSGVDTINLSGFSQPQIVDLRPGTFSSLGDRPDPSIPHYVNVVAIAANTIIENVIGGSGRDTITGNTANNTITFGAGADTFVYGPNGGADTITDFSVSQDRLDLTAFSSSAALA
ncbi:M10 family metallopeptidase C-terminal domain-containing protein, partial [Hyphomonas sp.]|uniref:M10 family metallopeptidase C-terminal domain-containing protein n=1 Tax=Hyphomonas sp. TaxID=87 RepID=UPI0025C17D3C